MTDNRCKGLLQIFQMQSKTENLRHVYDLGDHPTAVFFDDAGTGDFGLVLSGEFATEHARIRVRGEKLC